MIQARVVFAACALVAGTALTGAQSADPPGRKVYQPQFENGWVKVTRVHYEPHERLAEHQHPGGPNIYVYLNDGGPVLFKHEHGDSGEMAATRPPTKARAYRLAGARQETHIVENRSDLPSDFLEVSLKTDINLKTFAGRHESPPEDGATDIHAVEFDTDQIRITRVRCAGANVCEPTTASYPTLQVGLWPAAPSEWVEPGTMLRYAHQDSRAEYLLVELKSKPVTTR